MMIRQLTISALVLTALVVLSACEKGGSSDGGSGSSDSTTPSNTAPVAADDQDSTQAGAPVDIDVLANDSDADGDPLTISSSTSPANGSLSVLGSGLLRYTPDNGFSGSDSFQYTVEDGNGGSDTALVQVSVVFVNSAPVVVDDTANTPISLPVSVDVLSNDSDADGDPLTIASYTQGQHGSVTSFSGLLSFTPSAGWFGSDSFQYTIEDGNGGSDSGTVTVNVFQPGWTAGSSTTVGSENGAHSTAIADFDNDGLADLAFANARQSSITIHLNTTSSVGGTPSFATPAAYATGIMPDIVAADVNGDGYLDLLTPQLFNSMVVHLNDAANPGTFLSPQSFTASSSGLSTCWDIVTGDIDGDGDPDAVLAQMNDRQAVVMENRTSPNATAANFLMVQNYSTSAATGDTSGVALCDLNDDGKLDLATSCSDNGGEVWVRLNTSSSSGISFSAPTKFALTGSPKSLTCGDVDGDGKSDIAVACHSTGEVNILINQMTAGASTASFAGAQGFTADSGTHDVVLADLTGDGRLDVVACNLTSGTVSVFLNRSAPGSLSLDAQVSITAAASCYHLAVGDVNADGVADVVVPNDGFPSTNVVLIGQ